MNYIPKATNNSTWNYIQTVTLHTNYTQVAVTLPLIHPLIACESSQSSMVSSPLSEMTRKVTGRNTSYPSETLGEGSPQITSMEEIYTFYTSQAISPNSPPTFLLLLLPKQSGSEADKSVFPAIRVLLPKHSTKLDRLCC